MRSFASLFGRRGVLAAAVVSGGVLLVVAAQQIVAALTSTLIGSVTQSLPSLYVGMIWSDTLAGIARNYLPLVIGVFFCLWLVAPIAAELRLAHVVTRALLATGIGAALTVIVSAIPQLSGAFAAVSPLFGYAFPELPYSSIVHAFVTGLQSGIYTFVYQAPVVILLGVFLWLWLQKHPSRHAVAGMLDEV